MPNFEPENLAAWSCGKWSHLPQQPIQGFSNDTRTIGQGECFVAIKTDARDGHSFLEQAQQKGASAAIVQKQNEALDLPQLVVGESVQAFQQIAKAHRKGFSGQVVGITGSCGKTSTKDLLHALLGPEQTHATAKNLNNTLGVPITLTGLDSQKHRFGVIEAGVNIAGEMDVLADMIAPDLSIVTLIAPVHMERMGEVEAIADEKVKLPQATAAGGHIVFPLSCLNYEGFKDLEPKSTIVAPKGARVNDCSGQLYYYSVKRTDELKAELSLWDEHSQSARVFSVPRVSLGMCQNAALAIIASTQLGVKDSLIAERISQWKPSQWRGQVFKRGKQSFYADCYNANPVAMVDAVDSFEQVFANENRRLYVLGGMGELGQQSNRLHSDVGEKLRLRESDRALLFGQDMEAFREGMIRAGNSPEQVELVDEKEKLANQIDRFDGAVFLKASKVYQFWELVPKDAALC